MDMQAALRARLIGDAGVSALASDRVYWVQAPQDAALPRITLQTISADRPQTFKGFQPLRSARVQCDIWAASYSAARTIVEAVIAELAVPETSNGIIFGRPQVDGERDLFERSDTQEIHRISLDLIIWWSAV
jgi:hypothetical protein